MRTLFEVCDTEFTVGFNSLNEMGEVQVEAIRFINECFNVCVRKVRVDLPAYRMQLTLETPNRSLSEIQDSVRGRTDFKVVWKQKDYKMIWKRKQVAESYHSANSIEELKEQYSDRVASLCNMEYEGEWVIDKVTLA